MRAIKNSAIAVAFVSTVGIAADAPDLAAMTEMQKFYYQLGKNESKKEFYIEGYRQAMSDFYTILQRYKKDIKAYEAGKYLIKEGKITYPKVYRVKDEAGSYKIQIDPPSVEKNLTENDLFMLPLAEAMSVASAKSEKAEDPDFGSDGFGVPERDDATMSRDSAPEVIRSKSVLHLPYRNDGLKKAIDDFNVPYSSTKDGYDLYFSTLEEKIDFCMKVTGNAQCKL